MPKYYKYICTNCEYILDESKPKEPLMSEIEKCPKCGKDKRYFEDYDEKD